VVQESFKAAGIEPRWYVDAKSLDSYRRLGFNAVPDGGSLVGARNKCLDDAKKLGKACCQASDDISRWTYYTALEHVMTKNQDEQNFLARKRGGKVRISPVAAARFLLARLRASPEGAKLAGVLPTPNISQGLAAPAVSNKTFILGDFFVTEANSTVRFDTNMTLKEDYDFTCSHIQTYGAVLRCNRMVLAVQHYTNTGGAVSIRNAAEEQKNIKILMRKWPKAIRKHTTRGENEVMLCWPGSRRTRTSANVANSQARGWKSTRDSRSVSMARKLVKGGKMAKVLKAMKIKKRR